MNVIELFRTTHKLKYLGTYLLRDKKETVKESKNSIPSDENTIIILPVTYGVKSAAITKANRTFLMRAEENIIKTLADISKLEEDINLEQLVEGKNDHKENR